MEISINFTRRSNERWYFHKGVQSSLLLILSIASVYFTITFSRQIQTGVYGRHRRIPDTSVPHHSTPYQGSGIGAEAVFVLSYCLFAVVCCDFLEDLA